MLLLNSIFFQREQLQNAREDPLAAAAAAVSGTTPSAQAASNIENLLDIDFDGTAPASARSDPLSGTSGLEGLAGTPVRVHSPVAGAPAASNNLDDLLGVFGGGEGVETAAGAGGFVGSSQGHGGNVDLMNGFAGLDLSNEMTAKPPPGGPKKTNEDIMSLF